MPPEFEKKLLERNIPFTSRGQITRVKTTPSTIKDLDYPDSSTFTKDLQRIAAETDAILDIGEPDHIDFGPKDQK